jgi:preprotein translocase subunit SecF
MGYEMNVPTIAALLTIVGYSLNDTIVIFDRIRENLRSHSRKTHIELMNEAINDTLARTVLTSLTTLLVVLSILVYGGGQIHDFALTLFIGVIVGTYSSVFVASPILQEFEPHKH